MKKKKDGRGVLLAMVLLFAILAGCSKDNPEEVFFSEGGQAEAEISKAEAAKEILPEKKLEESEEELFYGYQSLNTEEQQVYRQLIQGMESFQEEIRLSPVTEEQLSAIANLVMIDHPEYFWTDGAFEYWKEEYPDGSVKGMRVSPNYLVNRQEAEEIGRQIEAQAEAWIGEIPADTDTYGKIKAVYELLIRNVEYEETSPDNQNIRSVFLGKSTVCMGYAKATQYLLNKMGIFCTLVTGEITEGTSSRHAWNLVKIGENYYYVDTTWGNPRYDAQTATEIDVYYSYLCCTEEFLGRTHRANDDIPLPVCDDDRYNYYKNAGCWYETYDPEQIRQVLTQDVNAGRQKTELYFARQEDYDRAVQDLVNGSLVKEAMQNTSVLQPGQGISWNIYSGGQDRLLVLVWRP